MEPIKGITKTVVVAVISVLGSSGIALAQQQQPQQCKVALVNMQALTTQSDEGKAAAAKVDDYVRVWKANIDVLQAELSAAQQKLRAQQTGTLNQAADTADLNRATLDRKEAELAHVKSDAQVDVERYRYSLFAPITKPAFETAKQVASEKGINSVIDSSSPTTTAPSNGNAPNCDITAEVLKRMNAKFSPAGPAK